MEWIERETEKGAEKVEERRRKWGRNLSRIW